jgi:Family of unknown function (DUF5906)/RepB DNA-primase from phage plasmid
VSEHPRGPTPDAADDPRSSKQSDGVTNPEHIERFLQFLMAHAARALHGLDDPGFIQISRLHPTDERLVPTRFETSDAAAMIEQAITDSDAGFNVYVEARTVRGDLGSRRGELKDTAAVFGLVIDSDADKNKAWRPTAQPSMTVETSPGNFQYWFLLEKAVSAEVGKKLGERIRAASDADHDTGTVTQPYRIAGTINYPSAKKRARGRTVVGTTLVEINPIIWTPEDIERAFPASQNKSNGNSDADNQGPGFDENELPADLLALIRNGVEQGRRSDEFFRAVAWLKELGWTINGITWLFERYPDGIAKKYNGRIRSEVKRVCEKLAHDNADLLAKMNEENCIVLEAGKTLVLRFEEFEGRRVPIFLTFHDLRNLYLNQTVLVGKARKPWGDWWLKHPKRRQYAGVTFNPGGNEVIDGRVNLWRGWGIEPKAGDWSLMRTHIFEVLASGNPEFDCYIMNWLAWSVQHPDQRAEVAIVFRGLRGTGKGTVGDAMRQVFGDHARHISSAEHLAGRFNSHMRNCCFLFADEAYGPKDKSAEGTLKRLITEPTLFIEAKGRDPVTVPNRLHVMMASNEDWVIPAGTHERRFAVFEVSDKYMQQASWFSPLYRQLSNGGYAAMLYDLLHRELGDWHPRRIPKNAALGKQQLHSLTPLEAWWLELLQTGVLQGADPADPSRAVSCAHDRKVTESDGYGLPRPRTVKHPGLYDQARASSPKLKGVTDHTIANFLKERGCTHERWVLRRRGWTFPPLAKARAEWMSRFPVTEWRDPELNDWQHEGETEPSET